MELGRFITVSWTRSIQSTPQHIFWRSIVILYSHLHLFMSLQLTLFPRGFLPKPCMHLSSSAYVPHVPPILSFLTDHPINIWWGGQIIKLHSICSPLVPVTSPLLHPNIFPSTLLSNTLSLCFSLHERPSFSHINIKKQNCSYVYFNLYIFG